MRPKYSEEALIKVCYTMGAVIITTIVGVVAAVHTVLKHIS